MSKDESIAGEPVPTPYPYEDEPPFMTQTQMADLQSAYPGLGVPADGMPLHACMGLNACAGADRFGQSGAPGEKANSCAGRGYCSTTADHTCHVQNNCANQGGCGLYGTAEEMDHPGANDCRSLGSCATPINAERFSSNGSNQGKSVWRRAREVFEKEVWPEMRKELLEKQKKGEIPADQPLPEKLGEPPKLFRSTGPTYLWISNDNENRGNMTACGASGMSGAGGCG